MDAADTPTKIPLKWAASAAAPYINAIPTASQVGITNGAASFTDGFPPLNFVPISAGGYPPRGSDVNGILQQVTSGLQWIQAGGLFSYDATFATAIGGYPEGAVVKSNLYSGLLWVSLVDDNIDNPDLTTTSTWRPFNRWRLTEDTVLYVNDATGDDNNNGLAVGTPFKTITRACEVIQSFLDLSGFVVSVRIAAGNYDEPILMASRPPGALEGALSIVFIAQDGAVNITTTSPYPAACNATNGAAFTLRGNDFVFSSPSGPALPVPVANIAAFEVGSIIMIEGNITHGLARDAHVYVGPASYVIYLTTGQTETINDDALRHWYVNQGYINAASGVLNLTLNGTPNFTTAFVDVSYGVAQVIGLAVAGSATGKRFAVNYNGTISGNAGDINYFPGDAPGTVDTATGGVYG